MQNNFPKIPIIISTALFLCSLFLFLFFYKAVFDNNQKAQLKEDEWRNEEIKRNEIKTLDNSIKNIEKEREQLETHFAKSSDIVPFLETVEGLALKVGVDAEVTYVDILTSGAELFVGVKASGVFSNLYKFLALLESSPYEIEFTSIDMKRETVLDSTENKNSNIPKWNLTFKMKLLSFIK